MGKHTSRLVLTVRARSIVGYVNQYLNKRPVSIFMSVGAGKGGNQVCDDTSMTLLVTTTVVTSPHSP